MSNQSQSQVIAHVRTRSHTFAHVATVALRSNATPSQHEDATVGQRWPPQRVCHYGTRKPQTMGPPQKPTRSWPREQPRD